MSAAKPVISRRTRRQSAAPQRLAGARQNPCCLLAVQLGRLTTFPIDPALREKSKNYFSSIFRDQVCHVFSLLYLLYQGKIFTYPSLVCTHQSAFYLLAISSQNDILRNESPKLKWFFHFPIAIIRPKLK